MPYNELTFDFPEAFIPDDVCCQHLNSDEESKEFAKITDFVLSNRFIFGIEECREKLRSMWTEFCNNYDIRVDTYIYDIKINELYFTVLCTANAECDFGEFDDYMCELMV